MTDIKPLRQIRSFVRREGRLTAGQARALAQLWPRFGIEHGEQMLDFTVLFGRDAPVFLEIGCGMGHALAEVAKRHPERNFIGIEVHRPGVGSLLLQIEHGGLTNVRVMCADAVEILGRQVPDASLAGMMIFFPDPWHKKRHHKRRLIQAEFVQLLARKLAPGALLHLATDWEDYARQMLVVVEADGGFRNLAGAGCFSPRPETRPVTRFEKRGERLGHGVWDLLFERA